VVLFFDLGFDWKYVGVDDFFSMCMFVSLMLLQIVSSLNFFYPMSYSIQGGPSLPPQYDANPMGSSKEQSLLF